MRRSIRSFNIPPEKPLSIRTFDDWIVQILPPTPRWAKVVPDLMVTLFFVKQVYSTRKTWQFGFKFPTPPPSQIPQPPQMPVCCPEGGRLKLRIDRRISVTCRILLSRILVISTVIRSCAVDDELLRVYWLRMLSMVFKGSLHILWSQLDNYLIYLLLVLAA